MRLFYFLNQFCFHPFFFNQFGVFFLIIVVETPLEHVRDQVTLILRILNNSSKVKLLTHDSDILHVCAQVFRREFVNDSSISNSFHQVSIKGWLLQLPCFEVFCDPCTNRVFNLWSTLVLFELLFEGYLSSRWTYLIFLLKFLLPPYS